MKLFLSAQSIIFHCAFIYLYHLERSRLHHIEDLLELVHFNIHLHDVERNLLILMIFTSISLFFWLLYSFTNHWTIKWPFLVANVIIGIFGILIVHKMRSIYLTFLKTKDECNVIFHLADKNDLLTQLIVCQDLSMYTMYYLFYIYYMLPFIYYMFKLLFMNWTPPSRVGYQALLDRV